MEWLSWLDGPHRTDAIGLSLMARDLGTPSWLKISLTEVT
jgi:hypothetical protein